jgi:hypothetical protein
MKFHTSNFVRYFLALILSYGYLMTRSRCLLPLLPSLLSYVDVTWVIPHSQFSCSNFILHCSIICFCYFCVSRALSALIALNQPLVQLYTVLLKLHVLIEELTAKSCAM